MAQEFAPSRQQWTAGLPGMRRSIGQQVCVCQTNLL
jgi:hypothetical protein